jgi:hypothetical protein
MFRFTIRDVLWLTVVVAMATGCGCCGTCGKVEILSHGAKAVDQHSKDINEASRLGLTVEKPDTAAQPAPK